MNSAQENMVPGAAHADPACARIESLLFSYAAGELDAESSRNVKTHLESCAACRSEVDDIKFSLGAILHAAEGEKRSDDHLSKKRRARIIRAIKHPILHWIEVHHLLVSCIVAVMAVALAGIIICKFHIAAPDESSEPVPVNIGTTIPPR